MLVTKSIASVLFLRIEEEIDEILVDVFNLKITNKKSEFNSIINNQEVIKILGLNEIKSISDNKIVVLNNFEYSTTFEQFNPYSNLEKILILCEFLCQSLWLIKDNSVQFELAHLIFGDSQQSSIHSNFWNSSYSDSLGRREKITFSKSEIKETIQLYKIVLATNFSNEKRKNENIILTNKISRLTRAFFFLESARTTHDLGTKISHYCSILESLFSISTNELKHRLSENVAFFIGTNFNERIKIYKIIQTAYDIRSSVVHGDGIITRYLKNDGKLLLETAFETDNILRLCFKKIMTDPALYELFTKKEKQDIAQYFQNLIFK